MSLIREAAGLTMPASTSGIPKDIANLLSNAPKYTDELDWATKAKFAAESARRAARRGANDMTLASPRRALSTVSPRRTTPLGSPRVIAATRPPQRNLLSVDASSRDATAAASRAHRLLDNAQRSPFRGVTSTLGSPRASAAAAKARPVRGPNDSPRVPCVQAGHRHILVRDYAAAEPMYRDALARKEAALGPTNPSTLSSLVSLSDLLQLQGGHAEAIPLLARALEEYTRTKHKECAAVAIKLRKSLTAVGGREADLEALERSHGPFPQDVVVAPPPPVEAATDAVVDDGAPADADAAAGADVEPAAALDGEDGGVAEGEQQQADGEGGAPAPGVGDAGSSEGVAAPPAGA